MEVRGRIDEVRSSPGRGKAEGRTAWALVLYGQEYSVGFRPPEFKAGDLVVFDVKVDGKYKSAWNVRADSGQAAAPAGNGLSSAPRPPAAAVAPVVGAADLRLLAASLIVTSFARSNEPGWSLEDYVAKVRDMAWKLAL